MTGGRGRIRILGGEHRGRVLRSVPGERTRPTAARVREALFSIVGPARGLRVLDLFAGTGAVGLEALSRGASAVVAVEQGRDACRVMEANAEALGLSRRLRVVQDEAERALARLAAAGEPPFDLVFADPPYGYGRWAELWQGIGPLVKPGGAVVLEHAATRPVLADLGAGRTYRYGESALTVVRG